MQRLSLPSLKIYPFNVAVEGEEWLKGIHGWYNGTLLVYLKPGCVHSAPHSTYHMK